MGIFRKAIQYFKTAYFTKQCKKEQRKWTKTLDIPKGTRFCPLVYEDCMETYGKDTNCFLPKAPGCPQYINHIKLLIQNQDPRTHVTDKDALEYIAKHSSP